MHDLDLRVIERALEGARGGQRLWLCTVLSTYGSAPRAPGSMLVVLDDGRVAGSLSGGCVEEDFVAALARGEFRATTTLRRYGESPEERERFALPCKGILEVLVECRAPTPEWIAHLEALEAALQGQQRVIRHVELEGGALHLLPRSHGDGASVRCSPAAVRVAVGPVLRLLLAGFSPVAESCAEFGRALGYEVIFCDPRRSLLEAVATPGVRLQTELASQFIARGGCHAATAVLAMTHDPRLDDLAMIEAVRTPAFYIGVMGSRRTSDARATRLLRSGGLSEAQLARISMPIGLDLGSKAPAEIALAVLADVMRVYHGKSRDEL